MLLVYTNRITPRLNYIFRHYFVRILELPIHFTTKVEEFVAHNGPKVTYGKVPLGSEFFIKSHELLFDQGINDVEIKVLAWDDVPCFFHTGEPSTIPFDIFAAGFYLITRYEEYLPHVQDEHERFPHTESIAYKHGFLEKPVVDIWAFKMLDLIMEKFPNYEYGKRSFHSISTIDVDTAYAFKHKGVIRNFGGFINDLIHFRFFTFWDRLLTVTNFRQDPYDTYSKILEIKKDLNVRTLFFFLIGDYTTYDKSISSSNSSFQSLIKSVADYARVGLHPSYFTMKSQDKLKTEKRKLSTIINTPIKYSRQHYLRLTLPDTYQQLIDLDIEEDYSMGYSRAVGFRASTCTPFYFFDLDYEIQTPLKVYPFCFMDVTLKDHLGLTNDESLEKILELKKRVKEVEGTFITLFHNDTMSENTKWQGWTSIYNQIFIN